MKVHYTQVTALLFSDAPDLGRLCRLLQHHGYQIAEMEEATRWPEMKGPNLKLRTGGASFCQVDVCAFPWPDDMGSGGGSAAVSEAYAEGAFGLATQHGALERALQSPASWDVSHEAPGHQAFVRVRMGRVLYGSAQARHLPAAESAAEVMQELRFMLQVAGALAQVPGALAYFNPNGEVLMRCDVLVLLSSKSGEPQQGLPLDAFCSCRSGLMEGRWSWVDCLGLAQLGLLDHEFVWMDSEVSQRDQQELMLTMIHYQLHENAQVATGQVANDPQGKRWVAEERPSSCQLPRRRVLNWTLEGAPTTPSSLMEQSRAVATDTEKTWDASETWEAKAEAEEMLQAWLAQRDVIRDRAAAWVSSAEFDSCFYDDAHPPQSLRGELEARMSRQYAAERWKEFEYMGEQTLDLRDQYQELAEQGEVWLTVPLMTNPLFKERPNDALPCVLTVPVQQTPQDIFFAHEFGSHAYALYSGKSPVQNVPITMRMLADHNFRLFRREPYPLHETQGVPLLFMGLMMKKSWMPPDDIPFVPVLALPGPAGAAIQIPWHVVTGTPPRPGSLKPGRFSNPSSQTLRQPHSARFKGWNLVALIILLFLAGRHIISELKRYHLW